MAEFKSRYPELTFFVNGKPHKFKNGRLVTEDKEVIAAAEKLFDVTRIDEGKEKSTEEKPKTKRARKSSEE